jgi:formate hydrogenlyase transcriptional activator
VCPSGAPLRNADFEGSPTPLELRGQELTDLFRALSPLMVAETESADARISSSGLAQVERLLASYFHTSRVGVCIVDGSLHFLAINPTLAELNGLSAEEHVGKSVREVLGDMAQLIEPQLKRVFATGEPILYLEVTVIPPTGTEPGTWVNHLVPIHDAGGNVAQVGAIVVEHEQKKLEESLRTVSRTLQQEKKRLQAVTDVSHVLGERSEVPEVFPRISASLRRVLQHEYAALALWEEKSGRLARRALDFPLRKGPATADSEIDPGNDPRGRALLERTPLIFSKDQIKAFPASATDYLLAEGLRSLCCVPLLRPKVDLGVLVLGSTRADAFKVDDLTLLNQVASQLAIALENARISREVAQLKSRAEQEKRYLEGEVLTQFPFEGIVGDGSALKSVLRQVEVVAGSDTTVLILGETGTGKGLVAQAIHRISQRGNQAFIALHCAAIPTGLLESELFGHEKGAFTGAVTQKIGRLEMADRGTLFLDEVGEIPPELQPKLLRVLQDHEFERLGGTRTIKVDLRLVAATNRDLAESVAHKEFRSDLFYRLNVFPVRLPSLRERREDIPLLLQYFVQKFARAMDKHIETIPHEAMETLVNWHWPGNVRELENFIERSVILTDGPALRMPLAELRPGPSASAEPSLLDTERKHIIRVLRETKGVLAGPAGAARRLGLKRSTLQSRIRRLGITREDYLGP